MNEERKGRRGNTAERQTPEPRPVHDIHYLTPNNTLLWVHTRVSLHSPMYTRTGHFIRASGIHFSNVNVTTIPRIEWRPLSLLIILSATCIIFPRSYSLPCQRENSLVDTPFPMPLLPRVNRVTTWSTITRDTAAQDLSQRSVLGSTGRQTQDLRAD